MKYLHAKEESSEYLRLALPLMARQDAALHPVSYAVWYEYVSGINHTLKIATDTLLAKGAPLAEDDIKMLFERHVSDVCNEAASAIVAGFHRVLGDISQSTEVAAKEADVFGATLQRITQGGTNPGAALDIQALLDGTQAMQASVATLKTQLSASQQEIERLREEVERARDASLMDGLTGLVNRKGFDQALANCLLGIDTECTAKGPCLLMGDIDHFKTINDTYGHLFGDKVIRAVAGVIKGHVKGRDTAARYGGEEFVILLPDTPLHGAQALAEHIRHSIEMGRIKRSGSQDGMAQVTLSIGVAHYHPGESATAFIDRADRALYLSKHDGRNRVSTATAH